MAEGADPKAALAGKLAATGAAAEDPIIGKVQAQILNSPIGMLQGLISKIEGLIDKDQVQEKKKEADDKVAENKDKPEAKDAGPPPTPGQAVHPAVNTPQAAGGGGGGGAGGQQGGGGAAPKAKKEAKLGPGGGGGGGGGGAHGGMAALPGGMTGDQLSKMLDDPSKFPHSEETKQKLSKVQKMGEVAHGFSGQLDNFVAQGGGALMQGMAKAGNFLGVGKDLNAIFNDNPYKKVGGALGSLMRGLTDVKKVTSIVGTIAGKIGMVLTIVGLLAMIFPPVGAVITPIARIINLIGIICDLVSFSLSEILLALNVFRLAKQMREGGSAEEQAATADAMLAEANDAGAAFMSLAMKFGPSFMKGFLSNSNNIIAVLFRQAKAFIGSLVGKVTGSIGNWAKNLMYSMGMGLGEANPNGMMSKLMNLPTTIQGAVMKIPGAEKLGTYLEEKGAAWGSAVDKVDMLKGAENLGKNLGASPGLQASEFGKFGDSALASAKSAEDAQLQQAQRFAAEDAANKENAIIAKEIKAKDKLEIAAIERSAAADNPVTAQKEIANSKAIGAQSQKIADEADGRALVASMEGYEKPAEEKAKAEAEKAAKEAALKEYHQDPAKFNAETRKLMEEREKYEKLLPQIQEGSSNKKYVEEKLAEVNEKLGPRKSALEMASGGEGEGPEFKTTYQGYKGVKEGIEKLEELNLKEKHKDEETEFKSDELTKKQVEKDTGMEAKEDAESEETHNKVEELHAEMTSEGGGGGESTVSQVDSLLSNLGQDNAQNEPQEGATPNAPAATASAGATTAAAPPTTTAAGGGEGGGGGGGEPHPTPTAGPPGGGEGGGAGAAGAGHAGGEEKPAAAGAIPYWPALLKSGTEGGLNFPDAMKQIDWMRKVAVEFKKEQGEARKKAIDTIALYGHYKEYAAKHAEQSKQTATGSKEAGSEAKGTSEAAGKSEGGAGKGEGGQDQAKGENSAPPAEVPEPEGGGFWARILNAIKRWAAHAAAKVFGWIQEQISSLILRGLCGVSMGDLKAYSAAMKKKQAAAAGVGDEGAKTGEQAAEKGVKLEGDVGAATTEAVESANKCDKNIQDANTFLGDVDGFEQQLLGEQAKAQAFIAQVTGEAKQQQEKKLAEDKAKGQQQPAAGGAGGGATPAPAATAQAAAPPAPSQEKKPAVSPGDKGKLSAAAKLVVGDAQLATKQVEAAQKGQSATLDEKLNHKGLRKYRGKIKPESVGEKTVEAFKDTVGNISKEMGSIDGKTGSITTLQEMNAEVSKIKEAAQALDAARSQTMVQLNTAFQQAYVTVNTMQQSSKSSAQKSA